MATSSDPSPPQLVWQCLTCKHRTPLHRDGPLSTEAAPTVPAAHPMDSVRSAFLMRDLEEESGSDEAFDGGASDEMVDSYRESAGASVSSRVTGAPHLASPPLNAHASASQGSGQHRHGDSALSVQPLSDITEDAQKARERARREKVTYFYDCVDPELINAIHKHDSDDSSSFSHNRRHGLTVGAFQHAATSPPTAASSSPSPSHPVVGKRMVRYCGRCDNVTCAEVVELTAPTPSIPSQTQESHDEGEEEIDPNEPEVVLEELPDTDSDAEATNSMVAEGTSAGTQPEDTTSFIYYGRWLADSFITSATDDKTTREYNRELVLSIFPPFLVRLWQRRTVQSAWHALCTLIHPLSPRLYRFEEPLPPSSGSPVTASSPTVPTPENSRVWRAGVETEGNGFRSDQRCNDTADEDVDKQEEHVAEKTAMAEELANAFASLM